MSKKKHGWIKAFAIIAAVVGAAVAVAAFLKKKGKKIREELEFDDDLYLDEEDNFQDDIMEGDETIPMEDHDDDEDMAPEESADTLTADETAEESEEEEKEE